MFLSQRNLKSCSLSATRLHSLWPQQNASNILPLSSDAVDDARKAIKWGTDYFLKAHVSPNEFYGQVGQGGPDHEYWGRPEDMKMDRPAYKVDTSHPGKLAYK